MGDKYDKWKHANFYVVDGKGNKLNLAEPITIQEVANSKYNDILGYGEDIWENEFTFNIKTSNKRAIRLWRRFLKKRYKHECMVMCKVRWCLKAYNYNHPYLWSERGAELYGR